MLLTPLPAAAAPSLAVATAPYSSPFSPAPVSILFSSFALSALAPVQTAALCHLISLSSPGAFAEAQRGKHTRDEERFCSDYNLFCMEVQMPLAKVALSDI